MKFSGFQKMTLLDFPGKVAATLFTGGCNLRCPFCHNASLVLNTAVEEHPAAEILAYLKKRQGLLDGVCITGGEPLLCAGLEDFIKEVKALGYAVKLDTNGTNPERLESLIKAGLIDYVAMDVKNSIENYSAAVGIENYNTKNIERSIDLLLSGIVDFEFRTTVVNPIHTVEDIKNLAKRIKGAPRYFLQNFVDSGDLLGTGLSAHSRETLNQMLEAAKEFTENAELRGI